MTMYVANITDNCILGLDYLKARKAVVEGARPIKQRMRRTPLGYANEEQEHLEKLLKADVIEPPVLRGHPLVCW